VFRPVFLDHFIFRPVLRIVCTHDTHICVCVTHMCVCVCECVSASRTHATHHFVALAYMSHTSLWLSHTYCGSRTQDEAFTYISWLMHTYCVSHTHTVALTHILWLSHTFHGLRTHIVALTHKMRHSHTFRGSRTHTVSLTHILWLSHTSCSHTSWVFF